MTVPGGPHRHRSTALDQLRWGLPVGLVLGVGGGGDGASRDFVFLAAGLIAMFSIRWFDLERRLGRGLPHAARPGSDDRVWLGSAHGARGGRDRRLYARGQQGPSAADRIKAYLTVENGQTGLTGVEHDVDRFQAGSTARPRGIRIRRADDFLSRSGPRT